MHEPAVPAALMLHRVNINVGALRYGETVDIDPSDPAWSPYLARGWLEPLEEAAPSVTHGAWSYVESTATVPDISGSDLVGDVSDPDLDTMNVGEILDWVGDDTDRARHALDVELDRSPSPRTTLVAALRLRLGDDDTLGG